MRKRTVSFSSKKFVLGTLQAESVSDHKFWTLAELKVHHVIEVIYITRRQKIVPPTTLLPAVDIVNNLLLPNIWLVFIFLVRTTQLKFSCWEFLTSTPLPS